MTTATKQTLEQALFLARTGKSKSLASAARALHGLPEGGWAETEQAERQIENDLPGRWARAYTVREWIEATHDVVPDPDGRAAGRWRSTLTGDDR